MSHCDRILHALRDGHWHTTAQLYRDVGPCILHSRIADLRRKGHNVQGRHVPGRTGADGYQYRLAATAPPQVRRPVQHPPPLPAAEHPTLFDTPTPTAPDDPLRSELISMILARDAATPRHLQKELGPSEVAHPCMKRMAFGLMDVARCNPPYDPLPSIIGTATHKWLDSAAQPANMVAGRQRWLTETRVNVTPGLAGSCDLYDTDTATVIELDHEAWEGLVHDYESAPVLSEFKRRFAETNTEEGHVMETVLAYTMDQAYTSGRRTLLAGLFRPSAHRMDRRGHRLGDRARDSALAASCGLDLVSDRMTPHASDRRDYLFRRRADAG